MKRYWKYIKPYIFSFIVGPLLMIVEVLGEVVLPKLMALIINNGIAERNVSYIVNVGITMALFSLLMMAGGIGGAYFGAKASIGFAADLRKDAFTNIQKFSFANIDKYSTGSLVTRITNDVTQVQNLINMMLRMMLRAPGMLIGAVIMAFAINRSLARIILFIIPVLVVVVAIVIRVGFPRFKDLQNKVDALNSNIRESLTNVRVIKSFVRDDHEQKKFETSNRNLLDASMRAFRVMVTTWPLMGLAMNATTLAIVWYGGNLVIGGDMLIGDLTAFITYVTQILIALMMTSIVIIQSSRAVASARRINEVLDEKPDIFDAEGADAERQVNSGSVEFKNVTFRYYKNSEDPVLDNINLKINSGEVVGIIGSTGSGKSTLVQLIPRLYDPDAGEVLVDGMNVRDYSLKSLRDGVSMVLQKNVLFSGSIMENLQWGAEFAETSEIEDAAKMAQAHDFITSFADGYDTDLGQGGVNVSGGQKQRLCIARAMLKKPKILILDDSTSAVDTATERFIRENLRESIPDSTKIIIAQRISSIIEADRIVVLDDGKIVGQGTHDELMQSCDAYKEIYSSQMDKEVSA